MKDMSPKISLIFILPCKYSWHFSLNCLWLINLEYVYIKNYIAKKKKLTGRKWELSYSRSPLCWTWHSFVDSSYGCSECLPTPSPHQFCMFWRSHDSLTVDWHFPKCVHEVTVARTDRDRDGWDDYALKMCYTNVNPSTSCLAAPTRLHTHWQSFILRIANEAACNLRSVSQEFISCHGGCKGHNCWLMWYDCLRWWNALNWACSL